MPELFGRDEHSPQTGKSNLIPVSQKMQAAGIHLLGAILLEFTLTGSTATTKQMVYVTPNVTRLFLSREALASFHLRGDHRHLAVTAAQTHSTGEVQMPYSLLTTPGPDPTSSPRHGSKQRRPGATPENRRQLYATDSPHDGGRRLLEVPHWNTHPPRDVTA